ncbi:MAG: excinuclease ABC subunit UvrC [Candidatus Daviesbacteria bacterium]|nr:excinuclease ABC subunit UvrC [Candidatus Daviesbacteria bacterium]
MIPRHFKAPHKPGVYIFKDKSGKVLYVGKAVDLKSRIASYFSCSHLSSGRVTSGRVNNLVPQIHSLETIEVLSEVEALILEANLIKKYLPPFNIKLTDDKDYLYIKITKEDFPKVITARKKELGNAKAYFGPFPSASTVKSTLKKLRRIFPWCSGSPNRLLLRLSPDRNDTSTSFSAGVIARIRQLAETKQSRPCFHYHLNLCPGPCAGKIGKKEYNKIINRLIKFLNGKKEEVIKDLETEMNQFSKNLKFENAQNIKKTIEGINYLTQSNNIEVYLENPNFIEDQNKLSLEQIKNDLNLIKIPERIECFDISNISGKQAVGSMVVLTDGNIDKSQYRKFKINPAVAKPNDVAMMKEILQRRMKHNEWPLPDLILVDGGRGQVNVAKLEIRNSKFETPIFGLAKRQEWIYPPEGEIIKLSKNSLSLRMLQKIRNESHRFALAYHHKLREKSML